MNEIKIYSFTFYCGFSNLRAQLETYSIHLQKDKMNLVANVYTPKIQPRIDLN